MTSEKSYGIPVYNKLATAITKKPTWKNKIKYKCRMAKLRIERRLGILK